MSLLLSRRIPFCLSNSKLSSGLFVETVRNLRAGITKTEKEWIKENSKKLLQKVKDEKGVDLKIDLKAPQLYFDKSEELKNADEIVKKILSLEYAHRNDFKRFEEELVKKTFQKQLTEEESLEIKIALITMNIQRMRKNLDQFTHRTNKSVQFFLYRQIHRRDKLMVQLFYQDNKRYEWLKEMLNLKDYELVEEYPFKRETRFDKFKNEVLTANRLARREKIMQIQQEFEKLKENFYKRKAQILDEIQKEILELGFKDIKFPELDQNKSVKQANN